MRNTKNLLPLMPGSAYSNNAPAKSGAGRCNPENIKATTDAYSVFFIVVMSVPPFSAAQIRTESMVALAGQLSGWPVSFVSGIATPVSVTTNHERCNSGGDSLKHTKEIIIMMTAPVQSQTKFIWIIAAVHRDTPIITAQLHRIAAESEQEARRALAHDHVCFFAGRIRQEASK
ncbi:host cell division inhibitor Icd-like protein [Enterobacter sp. MF024]|uniref:host cell division inhibitor Icd-like protein n=1 Tax=Enterobacter sp. MF024 TaxID=2555644 RepID=UPI00110738F6|nr:host cell division inhibitor Icd-like protein [Enterobacter sp. MF024]TLU68310.1 host cell division inhibitor Icd-like protein [Enterobacter sp. MF024]